MPSPFVRLPRATSKVDVDRPIAIEPVPERVAGPVFPYRGMETHGVAPNADWRNPEEYDGYERGVEVDTEPPPEDPDPIPVRIVTQDQGEVICFSGTQVTIAAGKEYSLPRDKNRRNLRIVNVNAFSNIYISAEAGQGGALQGYPLRPNTELPIGSTEPVFIYNAEAVNPIQIGLYYEYVTYAHADRD